MSAAGTAPDVTGADGPYIGLEPYRQGDAEFFFGRDSEQTILISNLRASRLTLLYAQSGAGKSSLLRAGVAATLTDLAQRSFGQRGTARNIPVVFSSWQDEPVGGLIREVYTAIAPFQRPGQPHVPVLDQLDQAIEQANKATDAALLVILDQFEEHFSRRPAGELDQPFADQLAACLNRADLRVKFLISIREDAYFSLGDLFKGRINNVYGNYFHLEHLTREAARAAIENPIERYNALHSNHAPVQIDSRLVDDVLAQITPGRGPAGQPAGDNGAGFQRDEIAAPYLQLVMKRLWDTELGSRSRKLRRKTLKKLGGARGILDQHLEHALGDLSDEQREMAVDVFHYLVTPSGTKNALTAYELAQYTNRRTGEIAALLEHLVSQDDRILIEVPVPPDRTDGPRYVVPHDMLVPVIQAWARPRMEARLKREKEEAERRAQKERTRAHRSLVLAGIAVILLLVTAFLGVRTHIADQTADSESHDAQSEEMAAEAMSLLPVNGPLAMLLSLQAYERAPTLQAVSALIQTTQQPLDDLLVSGSPIRSVAFSPDGHTLAVGESDGQIGLWNAATGRKITSLPEGSAVYGVAFSPDGTTLAAGDVAGHVGLWNVAGRQRLAVLPEGGAVLSVAFSPDGNTLAAGESGGRVGLWDVTTRRKTADLAEGGPADSVAFNPGGTILAVGDSGGQIGLWKVAARQKIAYLPENDAVYGVAFSPNGQLLAAGDGGGHVGLWKVATRKRTATLTEGSPVASVAFSPDGAAVAAGDYGGHVGVWNTVTGRQDATLPEGSVVYGVAFGQDGTTLAAGDAGGDIGLWDVAATQRPAEITEGSPVYSVAFSPNGTALAAGDVNGDIGLWKIATGRKTAALPEGSTVESVAFSPDGTTLAAGDYGGYVSMWNPATGQQTAALLDGSLVESVAFSPDGRTLAAGDINGDISLWNVATRQKTGILREGSRVSSVAFSPDGRTLAAGNYDGDIGLWGIATGQKYATLAARSAVYAVAFSPDGNTLATGGLGDHIGLWDVATRQEVTTLPEGNTVQSVAFSPGGSLVTGDSLGNVSIWNAAGGQRIATLAESGPVTSLAFSPRSQVLAIGTLNGNIVLLRQDFSGFTRRYFAQLVCGKVQENMSRPQWDDYAPGQAYQKTCP